LIDEDHEPSFKLLDDFMLVIVVAVFPPWWLGFHPRSGHLRFVVDEVTRVDFLQELRLFILNLISPAAPHLLIIPSLTLYSLKLMVLLNNEVRKCRNTVNAINVILKNIHAKVFMVFLTPGK
jgi:hypothetical protein